MFTGFPVHVRLICQFSGHALFLFLIKEIRLKLIGNLDMTIQSFGGIQDMIIWKSHFELIQ